MEIIYHRFIEVENHHNPSPNKGADTAKTSIPLVDPIFGRCPSLACGGMPLLPYGDSDNYHLPSHNIRPDNNTRHHCAKRYCALCGALYYDLSSTVDGCAWGKTFCHLFTLVYGKILFAPWWDHVVRQQQQQQQRPKQKHPEQPSSLSSTLTRRPAETLLIDPSSPKVPPTIYGFGFHPSALSWKSPL
jgi:hypothetical protein